MIAPVSSNTFASESSSVVQNPQQTFSTLLQQLQSGQPSAQTTSTSMLPQGGIPAQHVVGGSTSSQPVHRHHTSTSQADSDSDSGSTASFGQLGQPVQATTASPAQTYGSLQQDLQQVALNSDLLNAQTTFLQDSALSVTA